MNFRPFSHIFCPLRSGTGIQQLSTDLSKIHCLHRFSVPLNIVSWLYNPTKQHSLTSEAVKVNAYCAFALQNGGYNILRINFLLRNI